VGKLGIPLLIPTKRHVSYTFRSGLGFFAARLAAASYQNTTVIVLGFFTPPAVVAVYSVAEQIYKAFSQMFAPLALAMYPYLTRKKDMTLLLRVMGGVLIILVLVAAVGPFLTPIVLKLLNASKPEEIQSVLIILMIALVFQVTSMLAGYPLFSLLGRIDFANKTIMFGAATYLVLVSSLAIVGRIAPHTIAWTLVATEFSVLAARLAFWIRLHRQSRGQPGP
jgi:PST family polysaccharide transporter